MMRRAIAWATITLHVKQYTDGVTHIDIDQTATGGIKGTTELRTLDWQDRTHSDYMFGTLRARSRWIDRSSPDWTALDPFLVDGLLDDDAERGGPAGEPFVQSLGVNDDAGWTAEQVWGFANVEGQRYHVHRVVVTKGDKVEKVRLVYDWQAKE
jgi:hypothetical protein